MNKSTAFTGCISTRIGKDYRQQTESGAYEPTVQIAQVGSKI